MPTSPASSKQKYYPGASRREKRSANRSVVKTLEPSVLDTELNSIKIQSKAGDEGVADADFDKKGPGMLNPFKRYQKRSDEEVKLSLVK